MRRACAVGFALAALAAACAGPPPAPSAAPPPGAYPAWLVSTERVAGDFLLRQRIEVAWEGRASSFEAAVQKRCGVLTVVGFAPWGSRAFALEQRGTEVEVKSAAEWSLPFPPEYVLYDVNRTFFAALEGEPPADGERRGEVRGEEVRERFAGGRLVRREFRRLDGVPPGRIAVDYGAGLSAGAPPERIEFDNGWFGYRLRISTISHSELTCRDDGTT